MSFYRSQADRPGDADSTPLTPFPFKTIASRSMQIKCALSVDDRPAIGRLTGNNVGYAIHLNLNAGKRGYPCVSFNLRVNKTKKTGDTVQLFDANHPYVQASITWTPAARFADSFEITGFKEESWEEYRASDSSANKIAASFIEEIDKTSNLRTLTFVAQGGTVVWPDTMDDACWFMDDHTWTTINNAFRDPCPILRFFLRSHGDKYLLHTLGPFKQCVDERLDFLHQYREPGSGNWRLNSLHQAKTIEQVGDGMYIRPGKNFTQLPSKTNYQNLTEFLVYCALNPIREGQYLLAQGIKLKEIPSECLVYSPRFAIGEELEARKSASDWALLFVRLPSRNKSDSAPDIGSSVTVEWDQSGTQLYRGTVVKRDAPDFQATQTDFCICLHLPRSHGPPRVSQLVARGSLAQAYIQVAYNLKPVERELEAVKLMSRSTRRENQLFLQHLALQLPVPGGKSTITDLRDGPDVGQDEVAYDNEEAWDIMVDVMKQQIDNGAQAEVIDGLKKVKNHYLAVSGPAGTGKSNLIKNAVWLLASIDHKVIVCAPNNSVVDNDTKAIYESRPLGLQNKKVLRAEIEAIEKIRMRQDDRSGPQMDWTTRPKPKFDAEAVLSLDPDILNAYAHLVSEHDQDLQRHEEFMAFVEDFAQFKCNIDEAKGAKIKRDPPVPYQCTLGYHIHRLCDDDLERATREYNQEYETTPQAERGNLRSIEDRNPSANYMLWYSHALQRQWRLSTEESELYTVAREEMEERVHADIDILTTTLNNARPELAARGFKASVMVVDEAGQASFPALFVAMTSFKDWKAVLLFGDPQQLQPPILARMFTEVLYHSKLTALNLSDSKNRNVYYLTQQYRMAPSICSFPSRQFYNGKLTCHPSACSDNETRQRFRQVSLEHYGIRGESTGRDGSEYFMIDVVRSAARVEPGGTSLLNNGNVGAINLVVRRLLAAGIPGSEIVILTLYKAQMKLIAGQFDSTKGDQVKYREISTIDAFSSRESSVVILDLVIGKDYDNYKARDMFKASEIAAAADDEDEEEQDDDADVSKIRGGQKYATVTAFARDFHRICVGLTRAMDGLIVVGQLAFLLHSFRSKKDTLYNTLSRLAGDAHERGLVATDTEHVDTHPYAIKERMAMTEAQLKKKELLTSEVNRYRFIGDYLSYGHRDARKNADKSSSAPMDPLFATKAEDGPWPTPAEH